MQGDEKKTHNMETKLVRSQSDDCHKQTQIGRNASDEAPNTRWKHGVELGAEAWFDEGRKPEDEDAGMFDSKACGVF